MDKWVVLREVGQDGLGVGRGRARCRRGDAQLGAEGEADAKERRRFGEREQQVTPPVAQQQRHAPAPKVQRNERLRWVSGFTGSAGVVIVLQDRAVIFVDGRYTVQVRKQVPEDQFEFLHLLEDPHLPWLAGQLEAGARVGIDPRLHPYRWYQEAEKTLDKAGIELVRTELLGD